MKPYYFYKIFFYVLNVKIGKEDDFMFKKDIDNILFITKNDGTKMTFRVLFTHHSDTFNKDYAAFYNEADENHLLLFTYDEEYNLQKVQTQEEYAELEKVLHAYDEYMAKQKNN